MTAFIIAANRKGGTRKSSVIELAADACVERAVDFRIFETDGQGRLRSRFPDRVETISLPPSEELRRDDAADAAALARLDDLLHSVSLLPIVFLDIGANVIGRVAEIFVATGLSEYLCAAGIETVVFSPITTEAESIQEGEIALKIMTTAIPTARPMVALCEDGASFDSITHPAARTAFERTFRPLISENRSFAVPRLLPRSLAALEGAAMTPRAFARLSDESLFAALPGIPRSVARFLRGQVAEYAERAGSEVLALLPFLRGEAA